MADTIARKIQNAIANPHLAAPPKTENSGSRTPHGTIVRAPNKVFYFLADTAFSKTTQVWDLTPDLSLAECRDGQISNTFLSHADAAADAKLRANHEAAGRHTMATAATGSSSTTVPLLAPQPAYLLNKRAWFLSSDMQCVETGPSGAAAAVVAAEVSSPLWRTWRIAFPPRSKHSAHEIYLSPVATGGCRQESFIKDDYEYVWDMDGVNQGGRLYRMPNSRYATRQERVQIGEFAAGRGREKTAVFVVDASMLDPVVAVITCMALVNRVDSFEDWEFKEE